MQKNFKKKLLVVLMGLYAPFAYANRDVSSIPNFETFFNNIVTLPNLVLTILRIGSMLAGIFTASVAVMFWVISTRVWAGNIPKFINPQKVPSPAQCAVLFFAGVFLFLVGDGFLGLALAVSTSTGEELQSVYSTVTYSNTKSTTEMLNVMVLSLVKSVGVLIGFIGIMSCGLDLRASSLQRKEHSTAKILFKFIASGFIAVPVVLSDIVGNTIGFNVLRFLFQ